MAVQEPREKIRFRMRLHKRPVKMRRLAYKSDLPSVCSFLASSKFLYLILMMGNDGDTGARVAVERCGGGGGAAATDSWWGGTAAADPTTGKATAADLAVGSAAAVDPAPLARSNRLWRWWWGATTGLWRHRRWRQRRTAVHGFLEFYFVFAIFILCADDINTHMEK